jgi:hypothetical protein
VEQDLAGLIARMRLKFHAEPAVALVRSLEIASGDRVREREEARGIAPVFAQALEIELEFAIEHGLQTAVAKHSDRSSRRWRRSPPCRRRTSTLPRCRRRPQPGRTNARLPGPPPISAKVPYQRRSRLTRSALSQVSIGLGAGSAVMNRDCLPLRPKVSSRASQTLHTRLRQEALPAKVATSCCPGFAIVFRCISRRWPE